MLLTELLENLFERPEGRRRREKKIRVGLVAEAAEQRCLLSAASVYLGSEIPVGGSNPGGGPAGTTAPLSTLPVLNSLPGAPVTLTLKFDGYTDDSPDWIAFRNSGSGPIVTPAFDLDGDATTFNDEERRQIEEIWYRVAEDFSPFNINVTTIAPDSLDDFEDALVVIGGNGSWAPPAGGWGILNGFSTGGSNVSYVFSELFFNPHQITSAASHEAGHTFGLNHQSVYDGAGNKVEEYNPGDPISGPIMGVGYSTTRDTWWLGTSTVSSTTIQDDMAALTKPANLTLVHRTDDFGSTIAAASRLDVTSPSVAVSGVLDRNDDADVFRFETNSGPISFAVNGLDVNRIYNTQGLTPGTNADLILRLYDANGLLIAEDNPTDSFSASLSVTVSAGSYFVEVTSTDDYGTIGEYDLTGDVIPLPSTPVMVGPTGILSSLNPLFEWTVGANAASYELEVANVTLNLPRYYVRNVTTTSHLAQFSFVEGDYTARVRTVAADGTFTEWSNVVSFTLDVPAPSKPILSRPTGTIATSFPTFVWNFQAEASLYNLVVTNSDTGERVILRNNHETNTYRHFNPLADGNYSATVQAFNAVGESSPVSDPLTFTIDAPPPTAPTVTAPALTTNSINPRIEWTAVEDAWRYDLWVNYRNQGVSQYIRDTEIEGRTYYETSNLPQGTYVAWVRATNGNGETGRWSPGYSFSVDILPPDRPVLTGPAPVAPAVALEDQLPTFTWNAVARAETYDLWVNNDTTGQVQIIRNTSIVGTSYTSLTTLPQGRYRAWVRGINSAGEVGSWSAALGFEIDLPRPTAPTIVSPTPNPAGSVETSTPTFTWNTQVPGDYYQLAVNDITLGRRAFIQDNIVGQSFTVPASMRLQEHTYDVWVRAVNLAGEYSPWSDVYRVRIDIPNPVTPVIIGPSNTINTSRPTLQWVHSSESVRYEVIIRDLERQENIVLQVKSFTVNPAQDVASYTLLPANALGRGTYRFWVRAFNSQDTASAWSSSRTFAVAANGFSEGGSGDITESINGLLTGLSYSTGNSSPISTYRDLDGFRAAESTVDDIVTETSVPSNTDSVITAEQPIEADVAEDDAALMTVMADLADPTSQELHHNSLTAAVASQQKEANSQTAGLTAAMLALLPIRRRRSDRRQNDQ